MNSADEAVDGVTRCGRCGRSWSPGRGTCPLDGSCLAQENVHDQLTVVLSRSMIAEARSAEPLDEHDEHEHNEHNEHDEHDEYDETTTDVSALDGARDVGGTTTMIPSSSAPTALIATGPVDSGEITAQTARDVESEPPPTAQPASDPTTVTRLDSGFIRLVPGTFISDYVVERLLGSGGMGAVYAASHERLGRRVAIKVIAPSLSVDANATERFEQESQALARLSHPNIVDVLSVGTLPGDGRGYFVMAWLDGESLAARLARGRFSLDDALDVLDQVARGLGAAHAVGIIHRDLKPDNIMLQRVGTEPRPIVKLLDFGLAKLAEHRRTENTATNVMFGTAAYMSPEQCRSARDVGPETDVYALGCVAYELLCGRLPFAYDNVAELVAAHQAEEPPHARKLAPHLDPILDSLLFAMLSKDPRRRPTVEQVRATLALAGSAARVEHRSAPPSTLNSPPRVRGSRIILVAGVASLLIATVVLAARGRAEDPRVEHRVEGIRLDEGAQNQRAGTPLDAPAPVAVNAPAVDAGVATPRVDAGKDTATSKRKSRVIPVDPVVADDTAPPSAPASLDAGQPEVRAAATATATAAERVEPTPRDRAPPAESRPSKVPAEKRPRLERDPDRNQTFNPFKRQPQ